MWVTMRSSWSRVGPSPNMTPVLVREDSHPGEEGHQDAPKDGQPHWKLQGQGRSPPPVPREHGPAMPPSQTSGLQGWESPSCRASAPGLWYFVLTAQGHGPGPPGLPSMHWPPSLIKTVPHYCQQENGAVQMWVPVSFPAAPEPPSFCLRVCETWAPSAPPPSETGCKHFHLPV